MNRLPLIASLLSAAALAQAPAAPATPATQDVEAVGEAAIMDGNRALARDRAIEDALRKAVEQACGTMVVASSETRDFKLVSDRILTQAKGYVSKYDVLSTKEDAGVLQVRIAAKVGTDKLATDLEAIGLTLARKGMPRVAILIAEQRIDEEKPAAWWGAQDGKAAAAGAMKIDQRLVENAVLAEWTPAGFTFVDTEALAGKVRAAGIVTTSPSQEQIREIGDLSEADVVIFGTAVATKQQDQKNLLQGMSQGAETVSGVTCTATISARAFNADSAEVLTAAEATSPAFNQGALSCGRDALVKAAGEFQAKLQKGLIAAWNRQLGGSARVRLRLSGIDSLKTLSTFKQLVQSTIRGVQQVDQKSFSKGKADLDVRLQGTVDAFAQELESKKIGKKRISVISMTASVVEAQLSQ
ncbi:MAG: flagellar assembly protein T N-terminal domain-containing protein [Myxococcota bacterium]|nr:flagellar assembly protein T N-terminal domain-containing protein [Myxococcota bacterium]